MYGRRRRGFKGTWFPVYGTAVGEDNEFQTAGIQSSIITRPGGHQDVTTVIFPLVNSDDPQPAGNLLNDVVGQEYALRRIVGKAVFWWTGSSGDIAPEVVAYSKVGLGFFIAEADVSGNVPIGAVQGSGTDTDADTFENYSPLAVGTMRQPWIWRRTWILGKILATGPTLEDFADIPPSSTNASYGSVLDGPHIDAKTRRRVRQHERLWMAVSARNLSGLTGTVTYDFDIDVRLFGAMRRARNQGQF